MTLPAFVEDAASALENYLGEHQVPPLVRALVEREIRTLRDQADRQTPARRGPYIERAAVQQAIVKKIRDWYDAEAVPALRELACDLGIELEENPELEVTGG